MKCKLLLLAFCFMSTISFADIVLYGRVSAAAENDQFQNSTVPGTNNVQDYGSYFGIRGTDSLYGDTSAVWQLEQLLDISAGQAYYNVSAGGMTVSRRGISGINNGRVVSNMNVLASGETYVGIQGGWGRMRLGNLSNYMRENMGAVDLYNYGNGDNGFSTWSRTTKILPVAIGYDSPTWGGFSFAGQYSFDTNGQRGVSGIGGTTNFGSGLNGYYSGGVYSMGMGWEYGPYSIQLGSQIFSDVGTYATGTSGAEIPPGYPQYAAYSDGYADRLELGFNDPDGLILGIGMQITQGLGWFGWANSGGSFDNYIYNPGYNVAGLNNNQYQTQEAALSLGYHFGPWTPKIGYAYGNNMMYGGNIGSILTGTANQISNSGYQQAVAELDWNVTLRTIIFINYGQEWYGSTLQNISYCGNACSTAGSIVNANNQAFINQSTAAIGLSHTF